MKKLKIMVMTLIFLLTLVFTNVSADVWNFSTLEIPIGSASTSSVKTKTTNTGRTEATFKLKYGKARVIRVWTYTSNMKTLLGPVIGTVEDGGTTYQDYYSSSPHNSGLTIKLSYRDYDGGLGAPYTTSGNINYY